MTKFTTYKPVQTIPGTISRIVIWVTDSKQHVIVVSYDGVNWHLPSGSPQPDETIQQTAARIFKYNTGLSIDHCINKIATVGYYKMANSTHVHTKVKCDLGDESAPTLKPAAAMAKAVPIKSIPLPD